MRGENVGPLATSIEVVARKVDGRRLLAAPEAKAPVNTEAETVTTVPVGMYEIAVPKPVMLEGAEVGKQSQKAATIQWVGFFEPTSRRGFGGLHWVFSSPSRLLKKSDEIDARDTFESNVPSL